ncbi:MAG: hypothetical protein LBG95_06960 [Treponema sp.]|nr:hypothetical protein [Treponema sp.]
MKNIAVIAVIAAIFACLSFTVCKNAIHEERPGGLEQFTEKPVTITWKGDIKDEVQSFQTNVQIYSMNNRTATYAALSQTYRLSVSAINNRILTRIDFDYGSDIPMRSVISDGEEFIAFNPETEEIGYRLQIEDAQSPLNRIFGNQSVLSRVNLPLIREEARRLSLSMREETDGGDNTLLLELPPGLLPQYGTDAILSSRIAFDMNRETVLETEVIMKREDDTIVTTTVTPVYEESNGVPVKIGQITVIDSKAPGLIEGFDPDTPLYNSLDDIPELSQHEFAQMQAEGAIHEDTGMVFGNPADLSNIETIYEVYQDIEINSTPEHLFRLIQK